MQSGNKPRAARGHDDTPERHEPADESTQTGARTSARNDLVHAHLAFARILAAKVYANRLCAELEFEDFMQFACIGLTEAADRFHPGQGASFQSFAAARIQGAVRNGVEFLTERQQQIAARARLLNVQAAQTGSVEHRIAGLAKVAMGAAVEFALGPSSLLRSDDASCSDRTCEAVIRSLIARKAIELLACLPESERVVMQRHYLQQSTFDDIATHLGVTKGRISQIHKSAVLRLRDLLGEMENNT
jgi:RNA polymerase sigma factor FliA